MQIASSLTFYLFVILMIVVLIGLYRPSIVLWWEDVRPRKKVLKYYGILGSVCLLIYMILTLTQ